MIFRPLIKRNGSGALTQTQPESVKYPTVSGFDLDLRGELIIMEEIICYAKSNC